MIKKYLEARMSDYIKGNDDRTALMYAAANGTPKPSNSSLKKGQMLMRKIKMNGRL
jgi:hypothetical protein